MFHMRRINLKICFTFTYCMFVYTCTKLKKKKTAQNKRDGSDNTQLCYLQAM